MTHYYITIYGTGSDIDYSAFLPRFSGGGYIGKNEDEAVYMLTRIIKHDADLSTQIRLTNKNQPFRFREKEFIPTEKAQRIFEAVLKKLPSYDLRIDVGNYSFEEFFPKGGRR